ncbi:hypothetical protein K501DRAFT_71981 [Backusella circina FSU 941]|nr:hypothetical protein K501DRAFT_71981 [Backusella circina FSU 941]
MYISPPKLPVRKLEKKISMMSTTDSVTSASRGSVMMQSSGYETLKPLRRLDGEAPMKYTYNKRRSTKEEIRESNASLPVMLEETRKYAKSEPCLPRMIQEEEDIPSLPMLINEHRSSNGVIKPFDPHAAPVHQDSFQSYDSNESQSPQTPGPTTYFNNNSARPPIHPLYAPPHRPSLQYREQITGTSIPHEYSPEELESKQIPRMSTPELSRNSTLSTVSTHSLTDNQQKLLGRNPL